MSNDVNHKLYIQQRKCTPRTKNRKLNRREFLARTTALGLTAASAYALGGLRGQLMQADT